VTLLYTKNEHLYLLNNVTKMGRACNTYVVEGLCEQAFGGET